MTQKIMPYSIETEESLLGNILLYPETMQEAVESDVTEEDFYLDKHRKIFTVMVNMYRNHEKIDTVSLSAKLKDFDLFDKIGGIDYLIELTDSTIGAINTGEYIRIIKNKSFSRKLIKTGEEIANDAYDTKLPIQDIMEMAEKKIINITHSRTDNTFKKSSEVFDEAIKKIELIQESKSTITGVKSCYSALDKITGGFQKGDFIILAARPSMGKTAFALNLALNAAAVSPGAVAFFSYEMPSEQLAFRMLSAKSKVDSQKLRQGRLDEKDWSKINEANQQLKHQKIYVDDSSNQKVSDMLAKCRKLQNEDGLSIVFIDYIQFINASTHSESRQQEVSEISRALKTMARELNVPVIALSQLSRSVEKRDKKDRRPMLSDLRETGSLEQDADLVMFLYREDYYKSADERSDVEDIEVIIAKHRNGPIDTVKLRFEKEYNAFYSITNKEDR